MAITAPGILPRSISCLSSLPSAASRSDDMPTSSGRARGSGYVAAGLGATVVLGRSCAWPAPDRMLAATKPAPTACPILIVDLLPASLARPPRWCIRGSNAVDKAGHGIVLRPIGDRAGSAIFSGSTDVAPPAAAASIFPREPNDSVPHCPVAVRCRTARRIELDRAGRWRWRRARRAGFFLRGDAGPAAEDCGAGPLRDRACAQPGDAGAAGLGDPRHRRCRADRAGV